MDEIHVKSDLAYKGKKIFAPNLNPRIRRELYSRLWCLVCIRNGFVLPVCYHVHLSLLKRSFPSAIKSCIIDIEHCGLKFQIISTDNYPLNVNLFKLFSLSGRLETKAPTLLMKIDLSSLHLILSIY